MTTIQSKEILCWERHARRTGLSIEASQLTAKWNLNQVFDRSGRAGGVGQSTVLRAIGACLILDKPSNDDSNTSLLIANQVEVGPIVLRFEGEAHLVGERPLLQFSFQTLIIKLFALTVYRRNIPPPAPTKMPFFALIKIDYQKGLLAARGRGGGLALWKRAPL